MRPTCWNSAPASTNVGISFPPGNPTTRTHARTTLNDFPVKAGPASRRFPSRIYICIYIYQAWSTTVQPADCAATYSMVKLRLSRANYWVYYVFARLSKQSVEFRMVLHRLVMLSTVAQYTQAESSKVSSLVCFSSCVEHVFSSLAEHIQVEWSKVSSLVCFSSFVEHISNHQPRTRAENLLFKQLLADQTSLRQGVQFSMFWQSFSQSELKCRVYHVCPKFLPVFWSWGEHICEPRELNGGKEH